MKIKVSRIFGVALALALPAVAVAALELPNVFVSGEVISSSEMNANFDAIKTKVDELEAAQIASAETITTLTARLDAHESHQDWQTEALQNDWVNYGGDFALAGYWKDSHGVVHLRGLVRDGTLGSTLAVLQLPEGYRPAKTEIHTVTTIAEVVAIYITAEGLVFADPNGLAMADISKWVSLSGISFYADN